jgi:hypothetical protein
MAAATWGARHERPIPHGESSPAFNPDRADENSPRELPPAPPVNAVKRLRSLAAPAAIRRPATLGRKNPLGHTERIAAIEGISALISLFMTHDTPPRSQDEKLTCTTPRLAGGSVDMPPAEWAG